MAHLSLWHVFVSVCCVEFPVQDDWVFIHRRTTIPFLRDDRE